MGKDSSSHLNGRSRFVDRIPSLMMPMALALLAACAKGPAPLKPGKPAFFWATANTAWSAGDYVKANETLGHLTSTGNEFAARARIWQLVAASGLAHGYSDLADAYEEGRKLSRKDQASFREQVRLARAAARQDSVVFGETFRVVLEADKGEQFPLAFEFPQAAAEAPPQLAKLGKGFLLLGAEADALQAAMLRKGVTEAAARAAGAGSDFTRAAAVFRSGSVARQSLLAAMAASLYEVSTLYGPKKLDEPQRLKAFCILAETALTQVPPSRETKELQGKIKKALGKSS